MIPLTSIYKLRTKKNVLFVTKNDCLSTVFSSINPVQLAELPSVSALVAKHECGHRFIGTSGLHLGVGAV